MKGRPNVNPKPVGKNHTDKANDGKWVRNETRVDPSTNKAKDGDCVRKKINVDPPTDDAGEGPVDNIRASHNGFEALIG